MSAYTTREITREQAEKMLGEIHYKLMNPNYSNMSDSELEDELDRFSYLEKHDDILGFLFNFRIKEGK